MTEEVRHHCPNIPIMLLATKSDLVTGEGNAESMVCILGVVIFLRKYKRRLIHKSFYRYQLTKTSKMTVLVRSSDQIFRGDEL